MLPEITLTNVSREDVDRIGGWLTDEDVSSRWLGHYACGDPIHRAYEPAHMIEASESEWDRVFRLDPHRFIFSIYSEEAGHVGECQVFVGDGGAAELSLLIGRKDLWHRGYGTSTMMALLDLVFNYYRLELAWVNVPRDNTPAVGLFEKLGFMHGETRELCKRRDGTALSACILSMSAMDYKVSKPSENEQGVRSLITIAGLAGSGADVIGAEIARAIGGRFIDHDISRRMCQRLGRTISELDGFRSSRRSVWTRVPAALLATFEMGGSHSDHEWVGPWSRFDYSGIPKSLTKEEYLEAFGGVVRELALERNVVLHLAESQFFLPADFPTFRVFVSGSKELRRRSFASRHALTPMNAERLLTRTDRADLAIFGNLFGRDLLDTDLYDLTLNRDRLSYEAAAQTVVGAVHAAETADSAPRGAKTSSRGVAQTVVI